MIIRDRKQERTCGNLLSGIGLDSVLRPRQHSIGYMGDSTHITYKSPSLH